MFLLSKIVYSSSKVLCVCVCAEEGIERRRWDLLQNAQRHHHGLVNQNATLEIPSQRVTHEQAENHREEE